jgi:hypothetical protein
MPKSVLWLLLAGGLILLILGATSGGIGLLIIGFLALIGGGYLAFGPKGILKKEQVVDDWSTLVEGASGKAEIIFEGTNKHLGASEAPNLAVQRRKMAPGFIRGMLGAERDFLTVAATGNSRLRPYQVFLNARDYGGSLAVDWHLTYRPDFGQALASLFRGGASATDRVARLDLFDSQDLRTYTTVCHRSMLKAVDDLMASLSQDASKIERKSRGFLGVS